MTDSQPHVDFPASSPYALACGGTRLAASGTAITREEAWNETARSNRLARLPVHQQFIMSRRRRLTRGSIEQVGILVAQAGLA